MTNPKTVARATCNCPRGSLRCHHMAALLLFAHKNISCTDRACTWTMKTTSKDRQVGPVETLIPSPSTSASLDRPVSEEDKDWIRSRLDALGATVGYTWLLSREPDMPIHVTIEDLIFSDEYTQAADRTAYLVEKAAKSREEIQQLAESTTGQRTNPLWQVERKLRLTASNFGKVLKACENDSFPPSLFRHLLGEYSLEGVKAVQWGIIHEPDAIKAFSEATNLTPTPTGLWLHESGLLGASPDGLVGDEAVLEVKCPWKFREGSLLCHLKDAKDYSLRYDGSSVLVNKGHDHYHQLQAQMYFAKRTKGYLTIWNPKGSITVGIKKDAEWAANLDILLHFYHDTFIPHLFTY
ncbi:uncharacterized protein ISCGN_004938 [Ixodes scapularis]